MFFVYILFCSDGSFYVGHAQDVQARVDDHNSGRGAKFTLLRRPVQLVYSEAHETVATALRRERQLKGWTRSKKAALIAGELNRLHYLSSRRR